MKIRVQKFFYIFFSFFYIFFNIYFIMINIYFIMFCEIDFFECKVGGY